MELSSDLVGLQQDLSRYEQLDTLWNVDQILDQIYEVMSDTKRRLKDKGDKLVLNSIYKSGHAILKRHLEKQKPNDLQKVLRFSSFCCMNHDFQTLVVLWQTFGCFKSERLDVVQHLLKHCRMHLEWISPRKEDKKIVSLFNLYLVKLHQVNVRDLPPDLTKQLLDLLASMCDILLTTSHQTRLLVTKNIKILVSGFGNIDLLLDLKRSDTSRLWLASVLVNDAYTLQQTLKLVENSDPNAFYDTMDEHIITCLAQRVQLPSWREQEWWQILFNNVHPCVPEWMGLQLQMKVKREDVSQIVSKILDFNQEISHSEIQHRLGVLLKHLYVTPFPIALKLNTDLNTSQQLLHFTSQVSLLSPEPKMWQSVPDRTIQVAMSTIAKAWDMECNHLETLDDFVESVEQFQTIGPLLLPLMDIARSGVKPIILESVQRWIQSHAEHIPVFMGVVQPSIEYCVDTQSPLLDCIQVSARQLVRFFHAGMKWIPSSDLVNIYEIFGQWTQSKASASFPWRQLLEELGSVPQEHHQYLIPIFQYCLQRQELQSVAYAALKRSHITSIPWQQTEQEKPYFVRYTTPLVDVEIGSQQLDHLRQIVQKLGPQDRQKALEILDALSKS